jgi:hypothetical protein
MKLRTALLLGAIYSSPATAQAIPIGPSVGPISSSSPASTSGPGYVPGAWFLPMGLQSQGPAAAIPTILTAECSVAWFGNIAPAGGGSGTLGSIGLAAALAGTTTVQTALYSNDTSVIPNRPGNLLGTSTQVTTTSGQPVNVFSTGVSIASNAMYWICLQAGDVTFKYYTMPSAHSGSTAGIQSAYLNLVGTTNLGTFGAGGSAPANGISTTTGVTSYGVWPATLHGASFTETAQAPWFGFQFASVP